MNFYIIIKYYISRKLSEYFLDIILRIIRGHI